MITRRNLLRATAAAGAAMSAHFAFGQGAAWPERPIKLVVGFAAGGGNDLMARLLAVELGKALGQQVVVDNKTGAGGVIGSQSVATSKADGYTLLFGTSSQTVMNPVLYKSLPYDPKRDFASVALVSRTPLSLLCKSGIQARTLGEFIDHARTRELSYGTVGLGSITHVAGETFCRAANIKALPIHYRGQAQVYQALMAGEIDMMMDGTPNVAAEMVHGGRCLALAVSLRRSPIFPGVPTFEEAGLPAADSYTWNSIVVPAGVPASVVAKLNAAINAALASKAVNEFMARNGIESLGGSTPASAEEFSRAEIAKWTPAVQAMRITME